MNFLISTAFAMAAPGQGTGGPTNWLSTLFPLAIIFAIFYFLMIRPQQKQQKKHKGMLEAMRKGDSVITRGGIHGTVNGINDNVVTVEVADNIKIKFSRDAIAAVKPQS